MGARASQVSDIAPEHGLVPARPGQYTAASLHGVIVVEKVNVFRPQAVAAYKLLVPWRSLILSVAREHALQAHAHALDILHGAPPLLAEEVEADDAVGVYVWVDGDRAVGQVYKRDLGGFCRAMVSDGDS
jgi:hypothetical protein